MKPEGHDLMLGVTDVDLYVPRLNFVFGEADVLAGIAVISLARLGGEFYGIVKGRDFLPIIFVSCRHIYFRHGFVSGSFFRPRKTPSALSFSFNLIS